MTRILFIFASIIFLLTTSCQKCVQCKYTWTQINIETTPNGEVEVESTVEGNLEDGDFDTTAEQECVKSGEESTIESRYEIEKATTEKLDFDFTCTES